MPCERRETAMTIKWQRTEDLIYKSVATTIADFDTLINYFKGHIHFITSANCVGVKALKCVFGSY